MLSARWVPLVYVYTALAAYFLAFAVSPGLVLWPSALGAIYPARPLFQIGMACAALPCFVLVLLWYTRTSSRQVLASGMSRFAFWILKTYIARSDDVQTHGLLCMVYDLNVGLWMILLYLKTRSTPTAKYRARIAIAFFADVLLSIHLLSKYLVSGNRSANGLYTVVRAIAFWLELGFDYVSAEDFRGTFLTVNWVKSYTA